MKTGGDGEPIPASRTRVVVSQRLAEGGSGEGLWEARRGGLQAWLGRVRKDREA